MQNAIIILHRHNNIQLLQNLTLFWLQQFTAFVVSQNSTACGWQDTMSGSGKTPGGHITVVSCTKWSVSHGGKIVPVPAKLIKTIEGQPFIKMVATNYAMDEIISGSRYALSEPDGCLVNNCGLKQLKELRNVASGLVASQRACMDDDDTENEEEPPAKQPVKKRKLIGQPAAVHCPVVSFELPDYGLIIAARAVKCHEDIILSMQGDVLERAFNFIVHSNEEERRAIYNSKKEAGATSSHEGLTWKMPKTC
jgi:hypothetical protein